MNTKRLFLSFLAVFVFIFLFEWVFHGVLLKNLYVQTAILWRTESDMLLHFKWLVFGQAIVAFVLVFIFAKAFARDGVRGGIQVGIMLAVFSLGLNFIVYAVQPIPLRLIGLWSIGELIEFALAGAIAGAIYRPIESRTAL
jgi:hypothetical protein